MIIGSQLYLQLQGARYVYVSNSSIFVWNGGHTINLFDAESEEVIDVFSCGDFSQDEASIAAVTRAIIERI